MQDDEVLDFSYLIKIAVFPNLVPFLSPNPPNPPRKFQIWFPLAWIYRCIGQWG
jgi:hypothetical protein